MMDDVDRIMIIMEQAFDPLYREAWNRRQVEDALKLGHCHYGLVDADGSPLADDTPVAGFFLSRNAFDEEELLLLAVSPEFRGRGLGRALLDTFRQGAQARGAKRLLLEMREGNSVESLYRSAGYEPIGRRKDYYSQMNGIYKDAITFACTIV